MRAGKWITACLLLLGMAPLHAVEVQPDPDKNAYRRVHIAMASPDDPRIAAYEFWVADAPFRSTAEARLHSVTLVDDGAGPLERRPPAFDHQDCWSDGRPIHRNADDFPVLLPGARNWSCSLSGMKPGASQWLAVVPVDAAGQALAEVQAIETRTDVEGQTTPPPDTRPVAFTLIAIVLSAIVLLTLLRRRDMQAGNRRTGRAYLYIAPALIALAVLTFYPIAYGFWLAFTDASQTRLGQENWHGLNNFVTVFASPGILRVALFTLAWTLANVSAHVALGLLLAFMLTRNRIRGQTLYRTILLLPWAIPGYISVLAWNGLLQPDGLINALLGTSIDFTASPMPARAAVILVNIWLGIPFMMMTLSGALKSISTDMYEAAELDGVSSWDQFIHLTLPSIKNTLVTVSLLGFIWTFNTFNTIYLMTRGKPYVNFGEPGATDTLITYVFSVAFDYGRYGVAAAWSVVIFFVLLAFSFVYVKRSGVMAAAR